MVFPLVSLNFTFLCLIHFSSIYAICSIQNGFSTPRCVLPAHTDSAFYPAKSLFLCLPFSRCPPFHFLPLLHLCGRALSNSLQFINILPVNLMLRLPHDGKWSLLLWCGWSPPHIHKMWCLQVRTLNFGVSEEGLVKGHWGNHRACDRLCSYEKSASLRALCQKDWHPRPCC